MFMHSPCICTSFHIFLLVWTVLELFWLSLSFSSLFLVTLVVSMAPKRKSTLAWNPLHSGASTSSDHAPLSLRFRNDDAHKAFTKNFSWQGILFSTRHSFGTPSHLRSFCWHRPSHCHSQSKMGVFLWRARHLSSHADSGVLLQHARDWPLHTSFCYLGSRYFYSCHTVACYGCA